MAPDGGVEMASAQTCLDFYIRDTRVKYVGDGTANGGGFQEALFERGGREVVTELDMSCMRPRAWHLAALAKMRMLTTLVLDNCGLR